MESLCPIIFDLSNAIQRIPTVQFTSGSNDTAVTMNICPWKKWTHDQRTREMPSGKYAKGKAYARRPSGRLMAERDETSRRIPESNQTAASAPPRPWEGLNDPEMWLEEDAEGEEEDDFDAAK